MASPKVRLEIPEGAEANVIQETDASGNTKTRSTFKANAIPEPDENTEAENSREILDDENYDTLGAQSFQEIPKTALEIMFEQVRRAVHVNGEPDRFFAYVVRQPDEIGQTFNRPARSTIDLGSFGFSSRDQFNFVRAIQE